MSSVLFYDVYNAGSILGTCRKSSRTPPAPTVMVLPQEMRKEGAVG